MGVLRGIIDGDEDLLAIVVVMITDPAAGRQHRAVDKGEGCFEIVALPQAAEENRSGTAVDIAQFLHVLAPGVGYAHGELISRGERAAN